MRIGFIGCVDFSAAALRHLLTLPQAQVVGVVTRQASSFNADFTDLSAVATPAGVPIFHADGADQDTMATWLAERRPDVLYCFGWSYLLRRKILDLAPQGVVGFHPAALPTNRGRHPLIWALALGLNETASTFFLMDDGADTGPILSQNPVAIAYEDDAASLYAKITAVALDQITDFTAALADGTAQPRPQLPGSGNAWRKRGRADGQIDWRMSGETIRNLVRALTHPYVGAHCAWQGRDVKVWRVSVRDWPERNIEPGKVLQSSATGCLTVKCSDGAVTLLEHGFEALPEKGGYL